MTPIGHPRRAPRPGLVVLSALLAAVLLLAQGPGQQPQAPPKEKEKEAKKEKPPSRIFSGKIALRSSRQESETATYGFKGVGDDGQVQKAALATQPTGLEYHKVEQMTIYQVPHEELLAFLEQAGLHTRGTAEKEKKNP